MAGMTTLDYVAKIIELTNSVEWRGKKLAEQEATIKRQHELIDGLRARVAELGATLAQQSTSADSPRGPKKTT